MSILETEYQIFGYIFLLLLIESDNAIDIVLWPRVFLLPFSIVLKTISCIGGLE